MRRLDICLFLMTVLVTPVAANERPNIIYILADDAGYGDFGCYGGTHIATPNIDRMAGEGIRFTRHYAGCTVCAPSRCVLMTGQHTGHCRIRGNSPGLLQPEDVTIAEVLKTAGYETACIGKWGVGAPLPLSDPNDHGFDHFFGYVSMWHAHNFYPEFLIRNGHQQALRNICQPQWRGQDGRGVAEKRVDYAPDLLTDEAVKYIRDHREKPFFLYFALNVPHANNEGGKHSDRPEKGLEVPDFGPFDKEDWPAPEKGFAAMIRNIDRDVGRILTELRETGLEERTLVMFSSDNGPHQEGGHTMEFFNSNGDLRGMKRDLYEGGIRVPMIARWPGTIPSGRVTSLISGFQDILPTVAELCTADKPSHLDGVSLVPELLGKPGQQQHEFLYWEFSEQQGKRAVLQGDWKLVQLKVSTQKPSGFELYNVADDVSEANNVAAAHPEIVKRLSALLEGAHVPSRQYPLFAGESE
ncbi:MAG: arylsulfatase [Planctomycetaceae bacterium]|nr:arylsulfatase [Planctomycetaceae bacterium]